MTIKMDAWKSLQEVVEKYLGVGQAQPGVDDPQKSVDEVIDQLTDKIVYDMNYLNPQHCDYINNCKNMASIIKVVNELYQKIFSIGKAFAFIEQCFKKNPETVIKNITLFFDNNEEKAAECLCDMCTSKICEFENIIKDIALIESEQLKVRFLEKMIPNTQSIAGNFAHFQIKDENNRATLAKHYMRHHCVESQLNWLEHIDRFGLQKKDLLVDIICYACTIYQHKFSTLSALCLYIQTTDKSSIQKVTEAYAEAYVKWEQHAFTGSFNTFQKHLYAILKNETKEDPVIVAKAIHYFSPYLTEEEVYEIAQIFGKHCYTRLNVLNHAHNFGEDEKLQYDIYAPIFQSLTNFPLSQIQDEIEEIEKLHALYEGEAYQKSFKRVSAYLKRYFPHKTYKEYLDIEQRECAIWSHYALCTFLNNKDLCTEHNKNIWIESHLFASIAKLRAPILRYLLTQQCFLLMQQDGMMEIFQKFSILQFRPCEKDKATILKLLLAFIQKFDFDTEKWQTLFNTRKKELSTTANFIPIVSFLLFIIQTKVFNEQEKSHLFQAFLKSKSQPIKELRNNVSLFVAFVKLGKEKRIQECIKNHPGSWESLCSLLKELCNEVFCATDLKIEDFCPISTCRNFSAFITFVSKMQQLEEKEVLIQYLYSFMQGVCTGNFPKLRYETDNNEHLKQVFSQKPDLLSLWKEGKEWKVKELVGDKVFPARQWLRRLYDAYAHMFPKPCTPILIGMLKGKNTQEELEEQRNSLVEWEQNVLQFLQAKNLTEQLQALNNLEKNISKNQPKSRLLNIIQKVKSHLQSSAVREQVVLESDDAIDLFLFGTETHDCRDINGANPPMYLKAILGAVLDGKNRIIVVKNNRSGDLPILSCALIHILLDNKGDPVLFLDTLYVSNYIHYPALLEAAKEKARIIGLPLVTKQFFGEDGIDYGQSLHSLSGSAPYDMCDGMGDWHAACPQEQGIFKIDTSNLKTIHV